MKGGIEYLEHKNQMVGIVHRNIRTVYGLKAKVGDTYKVMRSDSLYADAVFLNLFFLEFFKNTEQIRSENTDAVCDTYMTL